MRGPLTSALAVTAALATCAALGSMHACGGLGEDDGSSGIGGAGGISGPTTTSSMGGGGTGGTGGSTQPGIDECPGEDVELSLDTELTLERTSGSAGDQYKSFCGTGSVSGPDVVFRVLPGALGTFRAHLEAEFAGVLYVQAACGDPSTAIACATGSPADLALPIVSDAPLFVVVDGTDGASGDFSLRLSLAAGACGDSVVNDGEQCDFGDTAPGDGCAPDCQLEQPMDGSDVCPGQPFQLRAGLPVTVSGFNIGFQDDHPAPCRAAGGGSDRVFAFLPATSGTLSVKVTSSFDAVLGVYDACLNQTLAELLACSDSPRSSAAEQSATPVVGGETYFVLLDAFHANALGTFELVAELE